jgi:tetratricopeptide (TPR) repeat protein/serine/threonine protein kinase
MSSSGSTADLLGRLADEFLARYRRGERPALTEYTARHPELAEQIRELFPALEMMEDVRPGPQPAVDPQGADGPLRRLGEYRMVRLIGRGGMGVVYEAEQESLGRRVALKVLPPGALGDARHVERFQREARAAARLHHTNIVPVFGVGEEGGTHYYVMQYIDGRPLDEVVRELRRLREEAGRGLAPPGEGAPEAGRPSSALLAQSLWQGHARAPSRPPVPGVADPDATERPEGAGPARTAPGPDPTPPRGGSSAPLSDPQRPYAKSVAHVGVQAAEALEYAAGQGVLHRDVKPSNLLLDVWGTVWLTDFGLAKASGTPDLTRSGDLLGTLRYMAPERFAGKADVRSDVYALGLTLYEMLALRPAFGGHDQAELVRQITSEEPTRLDRLNPQLPRDLVTIVHKAMARGPAERYQTAAALADDLRRFLDDRSIVARRAGLAEQAWRWCRRNPSLAGLLGAVLALLLVATGGGVWLVRQHAERQAEAARRIEELRKEVRAALAQAVGFRKGYHFHQARELLDQARERLEPAGPDELRRQVEQARADLDLVEHLDAARLHAATIVEGRVAFAGAEPLYAAAFAKAGLGRKGDNSKAVAARVRDSAVRPEIVAALDDWASLTRDRARREWLLAVARKVDPHPSRDRLRQPELWQYGRRLARVAQELRAAELSPQLATALGRVLLASGGEAVSLLSAAQARFPQDFWLNFELGRALHGVQRWDEALGYFRAALALRPRASVVHNNLGLALHDKGRDDKAIGHFRQALRLDPRYAVAHANFAVTLQGRGRLDEAIGHYRRALRIDPKLAVAHTNLGVALRARGRLDEAIGCYRQALRLDPKLALAHLNLGVALRDKGRLDEAIDHHRQALRLDPKDAVAHNNLGNALHDKGQDDKAIGHYQQALRLDPRYAVAHTNLGLSLRARGRLDEAIGHHRQALRLEPKLAVAHNNLGVALRDQGWLDEAIDHHRQALRLDPKFTLAHNNLGNALRDRGRLDEAIGHYRQALRLDPKFALAHTNLGNALKEKGQLDEAIPAYRRAIELDPGGVEGHVTLVDALLRCGRFAEAGQRGQAALDLLPAREPRRQAVQQQLELCRRLLALEARLPALLEGKERPAVAEQLKLARLCREYGRPHAAARLFAAAFAAQPALADDLDGAHRYYAACAAARAADAGSDKTLGEAERAGLRRQALAWLRADLTLRTGLLRGGKSVVWALTIWQTDITLSGVRDRARLGKLPAAERQEWQRLWADVAALRSADPVQQGRGHAARRDWARAADCYARALKGGPTDGDFWLEYAALLLLSGDRAGYARACAGMVERCGKAANLRAYHVARACTLAPDAVADGARPGRLAKKELTSQPRQFWSLTQQGALHYRAGRFKQAVPLFEQSLRADPKFGRAMVNWLWLALANQRLGRAEEARRWLDKAQAWLDRYGAGMPPRADEELGLHLHNWLEAHVLRREAEALLGTGSARRK